MTYIYFDESGDLYDETKRFFFVAFVVANDPKNVQRVVKKTLASLPPKYRARSYGYLHAYQELDSTRRKFYQNFAKKDLSAYCLVVDTHKQKVSEKILDKHYLYTFFVDKLLKHVIKELGLKEVHFIASRRETNPYPRTKFKHYLEHKKNITISVEPSFANKGLQAADMIAWAFHQKYERNNNKYYQIIKDKAHTVKHDLVTGRATVPAQYGTYLCKNSISNRPPKVNKKGAK